MYGYENTYGLREMDVSYRQIISDTCNDDYYDIVIFVDVEVNDNEIKSLIDQLPKFNNVNKYNGV